MHTFFLQFSQIQIDKTQSLSMLYFSPKAPVLVVVYNCLLHSNKPHTLLMLTLALNASNLDT